MDDRIAKLNKQIEKLSKDLDDATSKRQKAEEKEKSINEELQKCKNQKAAIEMEEISVTLGEHGLNVTELIEAIKNNDIKALEDKINKNKSKK